MNILGFGRQKEALTPTPPGPPQGIRDLAKRSRDNKTFPLFSPSTTEGESSLETIESDKERLRRIFTFYMEWITEKNRDVKAFNATIDGYFKEAVFDRYPGLKDKILAYGKAYTKEQFEADLHRATKPHSTVM